MQVVVEIVTVLKVEQRSLGALLFNYADRSLSILVDDPHMLRIVCYLSVSKQTEGLDGTLHLRQKSTQVNSLNMKALHEQSTYLTEVHILKI